MELTELKATTSQYKQLFDKDSLVWQDISTFIQEQVDFGIAELLNPGLLDIHQINVARGKIEAFQWLLDLPSTIDQLLQIRKANKALNSNDSSESDEIESITEQEE